MKNNINTLIEISMSFKQKNYEEIERKLKDIEQVFKAISFDKAWGGVKLSNNAYEELTKAIRS